MNGSIELDEDLREDREQRRRDEQDERSPSRPLHSGPGVARRLAVPAERLATGS